MAAKSKKTITTASRIDWNVSTLIRMMERNSIDFSIQRGLVWGFNWGSKLIHSILIGWPIGVFYLNKTEEGAYECLDSQQRGNAIYSFVRGDYKLSTHTPPIVDKEGNAVEIAKKRFKELPDDFQDQILQYGLLVQCFDNMTTEEKVEFFTRINSGKPVTAADISRVKVKSRRIFQDLSKHPVMEAALSKKAIAKFVGEDVVKNLWILCYNENKSLLDKDTSPIFESVDVTEQQAADLKGILDYIEGFLQTIIEEKEIYNKVRAKTHLVSLGYMAHLAMQNNITEENYNEKALRFFKTENRVPSISEEYNTSITGGAKPEKVLIRIKELDKIMTKKNKK